MNPLGRLKKTLISLSKKKKIGITLLILVLLGGVVYFYNKKTAITTTYQTAQAEKGTLIVTVTGSGTVSSVNNTQISTQATGVVAKRYVKDGDRVKTGDKIMEIELDLEGKQTSSQAWSNYQSAKNNVDSAQANMYSLQSAMFSNWDSFMKIAQNGTYQYEDGSPNNINRSLPEFHIANDNWLAAEAKYKLQQQVVNQAQTALNSAWLSYQKASSTVYAPITGTISGLALQEGSVITSNASTQNSNVSNTKIANVKTDATPVVSINLTEIDVPKITIGNKATITLDSYPDKTFTGKVVSIDTVGSVSSGVTTYPTVIKLDTDTTTILPNMSVSATIITATKRNVLQIPTSSIMGEAGAFYVRVMKNGKIEEKTVETGVASDSQTEILSGISEGEMVVTSVNTSTATTKSGTTTSPFSMFGGGASRSSGAVRISR